MSVVGDGHRPQSRTETPGQIFARAFRELVPHSAVPGFDVEFRPFAKLRSTIRFDASTERMRVRVSDLLETAPAEVLAGLAELLIGRLYGKKAPTPARKAYRRWVNSPATERRILEAARTRGKKHMRPPAGRVHDLDALFDSLNERYFDAALRKPRLGWSVRASRRTMGNYDRAHDAIVVNRKLDDRDVPSVAVEYVLFHEMLHVRHPVRWRRGRRIIHPPELLADERRFDGYEEAREVLLSL